MTDQLDDNDIIFDRNDFDTTAFLARIQANITDTDHDRLAAKKRIVGKFFKTFPSHFHPDNTSSHFHPDHTPTGQSDPSTMWHILDKDMLDIGTISGSTLYLDIPPITVQFDLAKLIANAIFHHQPYFVHLLLTHNLNIVAIQPKILIMVVAVLTPEYTALDQLINTLLTYQYEGAYTMPIAEENYRCIYQLASLGKLSLLQVIMQLYTIPCIMEVIGKICIQAIIHNRLNILTYFCPREGFHLAPDIAFGYFINSISHGEHLPIIQYFIEGGVRIAQDGYAALHAALRTENKEIIQYFCERDPVCLERMAASDRVKFGFDVQTPICQFIEADCMLTLNRINHGETYVMCGNKHCYNQIAWTSWVDKLQDQIHTRCPIYRCPIYRCPICLADVPAVSYINKN